MLTDVLVLEGERLDVRLLIDRPIVRNYPNAQLIIPPHLTSPHLTLAASLLKSHYYVYIYSTYTRHLRFGLTGGGDDNDNDIDSLLCAVLLCVARWRSLCKGVVALSSQRATSLPTTPLSI
jgi:hypothetical protein